jgi:hypothetical protein
VGTAEHRKSNARALRRVIAVVALIVVASCVAAFGGSSAAAGSDINLRLDFETGDSSQFSGLECAHPGTQFQVYDASNSSYPAPRQGKYAARISETANDVWSGNNMVRCLAAQYGSDESAGQDYYYGFSLYVPSTGLSNNLLWELHHPSSLYTLPGCGVAPFALNAANGGLTFRISTGNCTVGSGYAYWNPNIQLPGLATAPRSTWIDFVVHIAFSETNGTVEVSYRTGSNPFPSSPQLARYNIPTLPYANSANVHNVSLYTEMGLYVGSTGYSGSDTVYLDGYRRGLSKAGVMAEFPAGTAGSTQSVVAAAPSVTAPPALSGAPVDGEVLSSSAGSWSNSPTAFTYAWQSSRDNGTTWQPIAGSGSSLLLTDDLVGAVIRSVVSATNSTGATTTSSPASTAVAPPTITQNIAAGQTLSGSTTWTATSSAPVKQVVFAMDGNAITYADTAAPYAYQIDTSKLSNGTHTLGLTVTLLNGTVVWRPYQIGTVTVSNTSLVVVPAPAVTAAPALSGAPVDGEVLSSSGGSWSNSPTSFTYAWQSSRDNGTTWQPVAGSGSSLQLTDNLVGAVIRSVVSATNSTGTTTTSSPASTAVSPPTITQNISAGQTLKGKVTWTASPSVPIQKVVFVIDAGAISYTDSSPAYAYQIDTSNLSSGAHTLGLIVTLLNGTVISEPYQVGTVTVNGHKR